MMRTRKPIFRRKPVIALLLFLAFCSSLVAGFYLLAGLGKPVFEPVANTIPAPLQAAEQGIQGYRRPVASTYLTFPEWYLVFNPQEYGAFISQHEPSHFPYFASIGQFWWSYGRVYSIAAANFPSDLDDNLMDLVIGVSFTVEYAVKGIWENTIGRISELLSSGEKTQEDIYAARTAEDYGNFVPTQPWFEFPFGGRLVGLWTGTSLFGPHLFRKFERKVFLSLEYGGKAVYASIIRIGSHAVYGVADTAVGASITGLSPALLDSREIHVIRNLGGRSYLVMLPHYQGFTDTVPMLVQQGAEFMDIAGNNEILLTAVAPRNWNYAPKEGVLLFTMDMMASPSQKRIVVQAPVRALGRILRTLQRGNVRLEHLYDY
jgi:hypothetical protein